MASVEDRLSAIEGRNARVEADKAWEISLFRRFFIAFMTYLAAGFSLVFLGSSAPWLYAFVPVIGYAVSTLSLPHLRHHWQQNVYEKRK